jgi:fibrillarin-like rRNA methylase
MLGNCVTNLYWKASTSQVVIEVKHTKAKAKDATAEAKAIYARAIKKAEDDETMKIYEQIYEEALQNDPGN